MLSCSPSFWLFLRRSAHLFLFLFPARPNSPFPPQMPALAALGAMHSAYVVLLRSLISLAIFLSVACSADRVFKVAVHLKHKLREMLTGKRPEHDFSCRPLPDPASYALVFPKVR